jgi:hypothetical protein
MDQESVDGFISGTLVQTDGGPVPIEQVRVGDWVLSQSDDPSSTAVPYQQVVRVHSTQGQKIMLLRYFKGELGGVDQFGVSEGQEIWCEELGWTAPPGLAMGSTLPLYDGEAATTLCSVPVYRTEHDGVGWGIALWGVEAYDGSGDLIDMRGPSIMVAAEVSFNFDILEDKRHEPWFRAQVFSLEITNLHTYYVGLSGVQVRSAGQLTPPLPPE